MELKISGLKCDTPHCNYRDDSVKFENYEKNIGRECPICNSNLLTQEDYDRCVSMYNIVNKANAVGSVLKWINPLHYFRLIFGDRRKTSNLKFKYENDGSKTTTITE